MLIAIIKHNSGLDRLFMLLNIIRGMKLGESGLARQTAREKEHKLISYILET
jgi:hypothetical protein